MSWVAATTRTLDGTGSVAEPSPWKKATLTVTTDAPTPVGAKSTPALLYSRMWSNAYELIPASTRLVVCAV